MQLAASSGLSRRPLKALFRNFSAYSFSETRTRTKVLAPVLEGTTTVTLSNPAALGCRGSAEMVTPVGATVVQDPSDKSLEYSIA